jgi:hypothetical protein
LIIADQNLNETPAHFELKQIAKYLLWKRGYKCIATEVGGFHDFENDINGKPNRKNTIDVVGLKTAGWHGGRIPRMKLMGFEAKASLSDFRSGYCTACEYTYIIAPKGVVPKAELAAGVGLVEVDLAEYRIGREGTQVCYAGIECVAEAKSTLAKRFDDKQQRDQWVLSQVPRMFYRAAAENLWNCAKIRLSGGE